MTLYCTRNLKGNFKVGMRTEKSRLRRSPATLQELMRQIRHLPITDQADQINLILRGHYAYYGIAGNIRALLKVYRAVERYWRKMLRSRSRDGKVHWKVFHQVKESFRCCDQSCASLTEAAGSRSAVNHLSEERSAGKPHATFCGSRRRVTASGDPVVAR